jgi:hypothetical protein
MIRSFTVLLLLTLCWTSVIAAPQDRAAILDKAKLKFENDMARADQALTATIDKALMQATKSGNKVLLEKLNYEKPLFLTQHLTPTAIPTESYLRERSKATTALMNVFQPAIKDLTKATKFEEAMAVEDLLNETLQAARGFGLAIPDFEAHPEVVYMIENKAGSLVMDTEQDNGRGKPLLVPKTGKARPNQFWQLEREEKGFIIKNVKSKNYLYIINATYGGETGPILEQRTFDRKAETPAAFLFKLNSVRRELYFESLESGSVLQTMEKKIKGITTTYVTMDKKETAPSDKQIWKLIEVRP